MTSVHDVTYPKPDSQFSIFEDCGHSPFYEEPDRYNRELAAFVTSANLDIDCARRHRNRRCL